jgi:PAS domain S-box-containing protein
MTKPVVICIDDEPTVLDSLRRELSESLEDEFEIETAMGGIEALELLEDLMADGCEVAVVISDYIMPDMKGDEVLRHIHELSPGTLKIMLTGQANVEGIANAINSAKLYRYISKPWQTDDLNLTVKEALKSYAQAQVLVAQNAKLLASQRQLNEFLEAMPVGVAVHDAAGRLTYANRVAKELLGVEELNGQKSDRVSEVYQVYRCETEELYPTAELPITRSLAGESVRVDDLELHQADCRIPLEISATPIFSENGKIAYSIAAFQDITERKQSEKFVADYNRTLEQQVAKRTDELEQKNLELGTTLKQLQTTQQELIQSEKMAALGQLVAGVAHEINTPLGAIRSSVKYISDFLQRNLQLMPAFFQQLSAERQAIFLDLLQRSDRRVGSLSSRERRKLKKELINDLEERNIANADDMAELLMELGICQDISYLVPLLEQPDCKDFLQFVYQFSGLQESAKDITTASDRAAKVVFALKTYARYDSTGEKVTANITEGLEAVLTLYQNQIKHGVELIRNYQDLPSVPCYVDELNQVWTNLIHNGLQAMDNKGTLTVGILKEGSRIKVSITDSGTGIPDEIKDKIFQPFFTTKPPGEGSGLGLDIVKKIVEKHDGTIEIDSVPGKTTFTVSIPAGSN